MRSESEHNGTVFSCRNFLICLVKRFRRGKQSKTLCHKNYGESGDTRTHTHLDKSTSVFGEEREEEEKEKEEEEEKAPLLPPPRGKK